MTDRDRMITHYDRLADERQYWQLTNAYYHREIINLMRFLIPSGKRVCEVGCATGDLLAALEPQEGLGIDISPRAVELARERHPQLEFQLADAEDLDYDGDPFDYVVLSDLVSLLDDVQTTFVRLRALAHSRTRLVINTFNNVWRVPIEVGQRMGWKADPGRELNWLSLADVSNLLDLAGYDVIRTGTRLLLPKHVPLLSPLLNRYVGQLPLLNHLGSVCWLVARPRPTPADTELSVSVVVPVRNEKGNINAAIDRTPQMGSRTELIFVEGGSTDGSWEELERVAAERGAERPMKILRQPGKGKADAVRCGFSAAEGEVLMILDGDLTVPPEDLPKFYEAISSGHGEFINGCRLVYPMEQRAMRSLNMIGNYFFGLVFTFILGQRFKDTLCGTKVITAQDYRELTANRAYFGEFDPFGDFDLIFGAAKLSLKITELPIRYRERSYGDTNISRFRHGLILLRMSAFAARKMRFIGG